jgi:acetyl-CoA carboxylase biotin carboxyl carrier protein
MARKAAKKAPAPGKVAATPAAPPVIDEVRQLVQLMVDNDLGEVDITDGGRKILLKRGSAVAAAMPMMTVPQPAIAAAAPAAGAPASAAAEAQAPLETLLEIKSPMVGSFYSAASPDSGPYVSVGSAVDEEMVVCIIEAMKVMNEVKAECSGTIAEVCVKNAQPVEYGQVLFRVRPA